MSTDRDRLLAKAKECHDLADTALTLEGREVLDEIAERYEIQAAVIARRGAVREAIPA